MEGWNLINFSLSWNCELNSIWRKASIQVGSIWKKGGFLKRQVTKGFYAFSTVIENRPESLDASGIRDNCQAITGQMTNHSHLRKKLKLRPESVRKDLWTKKWSVLMRFLEVLILTFWKLLKFFRESKMPAKRIAPNYFPIYTSKSLSNIDSV